MIVKAENPTQEMSTIDLYIKRSSEKLPEIQRISIEAQSRKFINLYHYCDQGDIAWIKPDILNPHAVSLSLAWDKNFYPLGESLSNRWESYLPVSGAILHTQNHSHLNNPVELRTYDKQGTKLSVNKLSLSPFESLEIDLHPAAYRLEVYSRYRSFNFSYSQNAYYQNSTAKLSPESKLDKKKSYFLVKHQSNKEAKSYIIALTDPEKIELARASIKDPSNENIPRIVMGKVKKETEQYNSNWQSENNVNWSWELYDIEFSSLGSINCDTNPQILEEFLPKFVKEKRNICPWNYRIVEELKR